MMFDAHVHVGYYSRKGRREPWYYSPRRILGILKRCGVEQCIVSSTCAQVDSIEVEDLNREAREIAGLAEARAHVFLWVSSRLLKADPQLVVLDVRRGHIPRATASRVAVATGVSPRPTEALYGGVKLHELETPWMRERAEDLERILKIADARGLPVQMHAGASGVMKPKALMALAKRFPKIRFDFAHCRPMDEMAEVMAECPNVWTDTAFMALDDFERLNRYDWHGRLMFGTDLPVWQAYEPCGLTKRYREYVEAFRRTGIDGERAFRAFIGQRTRPF